MPNGGPHRAVILTAIPVEYKAVRAHLTNPHWDKQGRVPYQRGIFSTSNQVWDVLIRETSHGNVCAAVETLLAIHYFHPALVLFIGVAGGLKDVHIGDVVIPTKVYAYESGRANVTSFQTRPQVVNPTFPLVQLAQAEAMEQDWLQRLKEAIPDTLPNVLAAPIASGESVVASTRAAIYKFLRASYSDAVAVEMESYGFLLAAHFYPEVDALVIRGISDRINNKRRTDSNDSQTLAARHASAFAFEILAKVDLADLQRHRTSTETGVEATVTRGEVATDQQEMVTAIQDLPVVLTDAPTIDLPESTAAIQNNSGKGSLSVLHSHVFLKLIEQYELEIQEIHKLFGERRAMFNDQCRRAIQLLKRLEADIQKYYQQVAQPDRIVKFRMSKLNSHIHKLLSELDDFPHFLSLEKEDHHYTSWQKNIHEKFESLLEQLESLKRILSGS
jgi:nucleoside phosphorylase